MKHPAVIILALVLLTLAATIGIGNFTGPKKNITVTNLPWMIDLSEQENPRVLGITLGESTLQQAVQKWRAVPTIAYFEGGDDPGSIEAYFPKVHLGPIEARLILKLGADAAELKRYADAAINPKPMPSGSYRYTLPETEFKAAHTLKIRMLTYIPAASLDREMVEQHFGKPERLKELSEDRSLWLYPNLRLGLVIDEHGKEILQYSTNSDYAEMTKELLLLE